MLRVSAEDAGSAQNKTEQQEDDTSQGSEETEPHLRWHQDSHSAWEAQGWCRGLLLSIIAGKEFNMRPTPLTAFKGAAQCALRGLGEGLSAQHSTAHLCGLRRLVLTKKE